MTAKRTRYWIDGYNVILRLCLAAERPLEERRQELVSRVAATGHAAWIVFDARSGGASGRIERPYRRIMVQFANKRSSADDLILEKARRAKDLADVIVVTDDRELARGCSLQGARTQSVRDFLKTLRPTPTTESRRSRPLSREEIEDWKEYFGFDEREDDEGEGDKDPLKPGP